MHYPTSTLYRIVDSVYRYKWRWITPFALVSLIVLGLVVTRTKEYSATAAIMVVNNTQMQNVMGTGSAYGWEWPSNVNIRYFNNLLRDNAPGGFLDRVLQKAKLNPPIDLSRNPNDPRIGNILKGLSTNGDSSEVFSISMKWKNASEAERITRAFQKVYIETRVENKQAESFAIVVFLNERINFYAKQMKAAENAVSDFKRRFSGHLPDQQSGQMEQLSLLQTQLDTLDVSAKNNEIERQFLSNRMKQLKPTMVLEQVYESGPSLSSDQLQAKIRDRDAYLAQGYKTDSTMVKRIDKNIAQLQTRIAAEQAEAEANLRKGKPSGNISRTSVQDNPVYSESQQRLYQIESENRINESQRASLRAKISEYQAQFEQLPLAEQQLNEKTRSSAVLRAAFDDLKTRKIKAELQMGQERRIGMSELTPLGIVRAESTSSGKKLLMIMIGACVLGLLIGAMAIVISEWLDPTLRYASDVQNLLGVPVLASLPDARDLRIQLALPEPEIPGGADAPRLAAN